ncbi:hypothetical protein GC105_01900 [Alkalibaculum sp. M08DMB]|uniref:Thiamine biosynthesis protein ThiS n=1 Tax=Alkalibaculum sporogenes TaxID=2655001 RepID=A0A6A7K508_9FIRM|nr:hypothetical protein [Alkalibaculum sporogenes]
MIIFNNQEFEYIDNVTISQFIQIMKDRKVLNSHNALLITKNNKLISPSEIYIEKVKDGDIINARVMPVGG